MLEKKESLARDMTTEMGKPLKAAVEEAFANKKVQVIAVNIMHVAGKERRRGRSVGMTRSWKKAVVTLKAGQRLDLFEGV